MSRTLDSLDTGTQREETKLEIDDEMHCRECGVPLPWDAVLLHGYERCPECKLEQVRHELLCVFGSLEASDIARPMVVPESAEVRPIGD